MSTHPTTADTPLDYTRVTLAWTPELREHALPFRGEAQPKPPRALTTAQLLKKTRTALDKHGKVWRDGLTLIGARAGADLTRRVLARLEGEEPGEFDATLEAATLVVAADMLMLTGKYTASERLAEQLVERWVASHGVVAASRAVTATARMTAVRKTLRASYLDLREHGAPGRADMHHGRPQWLALRRWLMAADEADYAAARDELVALDLRLRDGSAADHATRVWIAVALPDEASLWRDLVAFEARKPDDHRHLFPLLSCRLDAPAMKRLGTTHGAPWGAHHLVTLVHHAGQAAYPVVRDAPLSEWGDVDIERSWVRAMSLFVGDEPARAIAEKLSQKALRGLIGDYFERYPELALRVLPPLAKKGKKSLREGAHVLLEMAERELAAAAAEASGEVVALAPEASLPEVLVDPPWRRKKVKRVTLPKRALTPTALPPAFLMSEDERARELKRLEKAHENWGAKREWLTERLDGSRRTGRADLTYLLTLDDVEVARGYLRTTPEWTGVSTETLRTAIAVFGPEEAEGLARIVASGPEAFDGALTLGAVEIAAAVAASYRRRRVRAGTQRWMLAFPEHAAAGLIPLAFGDDKKLAEGARAALRFLASREADVVDAAGAAYGDDVAAALRAWLGQDPLLECPKRAPKIPDWFDARMFPPVLTRDGAPIGPEATGHLLEMLVFSEPDPPYAGITQVREVCDAASLEAFAEALCDGWVANGSPNAHAWTVTAVALLGGDGAARWLAARTDAWAAEGGKRGLLGLDALALLGSDVALMYIGRWTRSASRAWLKRAAQETLSAVAEERGLSNDELEDRTAPDLGLDDDGSLVLDYGPRSFRVVFDEHLSPSILDDDGKRLAAVAPIRKTDDEAEAKAAKARWAALKKDAAKVAAAQSERLERALATGRRWAAADFERYLVRHPLSATWRGAWSSACSRTAR